MALAMLAFTMRNTPKAASTSSSPRGSPTSARSASRTPALLSLNSPPHSASGLM
jgi:hypothetical protein